jgi:hypothetical protein
MMLETPMLKTLFVVRFLDEHFNQIPEALDIVKQVIEVDQTEVSWLPVGVQYKQRIAITFADSPDALAALAKLTKSQQIGVIAVDRLDRQGETIGSHIWRDVTIDEVKYSDLHYGKSKEATETRITFVSDRHVWQPNTMYKGTK